MYSDVTLVFDIDGTIVPIKSKNEEYADLIPDAEVIEKIRYYKQEGAKIVFYTSRNMNSYNGNLGVINIKTAPIILEWLKKWNIPYDELHLGKVWPGHKGLYIDDRAVRPDEFLKYNYEELENICKKSSRTRKNNN